MSELLDGLNPEQAEAVMTLAGPVQVVAGAGAGKTTLLARRVRHLVESGCRPRQLLLVTFQAAMAAEMRERLAREIGERRAARVNVATYHAFCAEILRRRPGLAGLRPGFAVIEEARSRALVRQLLDDAGLALAGLPPVKAAAAVHAALARVKNSGVAPEEAAARLEAGPLAPELDAALRIYPAYQDRLRRDGQIDFADMLLWTVRGLEADEAVRRAEAARFTHVMVDEHQDGNDVQERLLGLLARDHRNICVVGDDKQAIMEYQGANPENTIRFAERWPGCRVIALRRSYRCSALILEAAGALIRHNRRQLDAPLRAGPGERVEDCEPILVGTAETAADEAAWIVAVAQDILAENQTGQVFVCYRARWQSRPIEEAAIRAGVPYEIVGQGFYDRAEVRDVMAYVRAMEDGGDEAAWRRIADLPARGIGERTAARVVDAAAGGDLIAAGLALAESGEARRGAREGLRALHALREDWRASTAALPERIRALLTAAGYLGWLAAGEETEPAEIVEELLRVAGECRTPAELLERAARGAGASAGSGARLVLRTLHSSKGLEADAVLLPGWAEGVMPSAQAVEAAEEGDDGPLEAERRLGYVGLTRAKRCVVIGATLDGMPPSRFLDELPETLVRRVEIVATARRVGRPPGERLLARAREIARAVGMDIPEAALGCSTRLSAWLDRQVPKGGKAKDVARPFA